MTSVVRPSWAVARRVLVGAVLALVVAAAVLVTLLVVRVPSAASPAHPLQRVDDTCAQTRPGQPC